MRLLTTAIIAAVQLTGVMCGAADAGERPLDVRNSIETTRFAVDPLDVQNTGNASAAVVCPDGTRYALMLIHGDVDRDGVWVDILVGDLTSLRSAENSRIVARLFTRAYEDPPRFRNIINDVFNRLVWLNRDEVLFRWQDDAGAAQIVKVNVVNGGLKVLTHQPTDVGFFDVGPNGLIVYAAGTLRDTDSRTNADEFGGTYVESIDGISLAEGMPGKVGLLSRMYDRDIFVLRTTNDRVVDLNLKLKMDFNWAFAPKFSPDGRYVIIDASPENVVPDWAQYLSHRAAGGSSFERILAAALKNQEDWFGRQLTQLHLVDTEKGMSRALWNAPTYDRFSMKGAWSADGRSFAVGPTVLPTNSDTSDADDIAFASIDVRSGKFWKLPISPADVPYVETLEWRGSERIGVFTRTQRLEYAFRDERWHLERSAERVAKPSSTKVHLEVHEDLNRPPVLLAVDGGNGRKRVVFDPNPGLLRKFTLGRVEVFKWFDSTNRPWRGTLYYPTGFRSDRRYPLLLQVIGRGRAEFDRFHLYGFVTAPGLGPSQSIYAAQQIANRGIMVLNVERQGTGRMDEADINIRGFESAIERLNDEGRIDLSKVGIAGESRPGWLAEEAITFSEFRFAAALVSDANDNGYFAGILEPELSVESSYSSPPFGSGLKSWLEGSTSFNADRIRTPLRLEDESQPRAGSLLKWELFSRLRALSLPVEYYLVPQIEHGTHYISNPRQLLAIKQGAVDWFDFWLNDYQDPDPLKANQYRRWRELRRQRDAALQIPRPPRLIWTAAPVRKER